MFTSPNWMPSSLAELLSLLTDVIILNFVPKAPVLIVPKLTKFVLTFNFDIKFGLILILRN